MHRNILYLHRDTDGEFNGAQRKQFCDMAVVEHLARYGGPERFKQYNRSSTIATFTFLSCLRSGSRFRNNLSAAKRTYFLASNLAFEGSSWLQYFVSHGGGKDPNVMQTP